MSCVASLRSRTTTDWPSATIEIGLGASYSKRTLPGFWMKNSPLVRLPSGPTWTKFPYNCCTLERYALTLSTCARCAGLKTVVVAGAVGASSGLSEGNSDLPRPCRNPVMPDCAAGGGGTPSLGSGAGVGKGMVSAAATDVSAVATSNAVPSNSPSLDSPWPLPAIIPSPLPLHPAPAGLASRPVWRDDD